MDKEKYKKLKRAVELAQAPIGKEAWFDALPSVVETEELEEWLESKCKIEEIIFSYF